MGTAYGYIDGKGYIRALTMSRADAVRNAKLNRSHIPAHVQTTPNGSVPARPNVTRFEILHY